MLYPRRHRNSPTKENISPESPSRSPRKQPNTIKTLIQLLKQHNIPIPQQLIQKTIQNQKNNCQLKLTQISCDKNTQLKSLKVQLGDTKFELKKMDEDFAEYKVMARMQKQKLVKKYLSEIEVLKKKIQDDNSNWEKRYTQTCQQFHAEKLQYQLKLKKDSQQKVTTESLTLQDKFYHKIHTLEEKVKTLTLTIEQKQQLHQSEKQSLIKAYEDEVNSQIQSLKSSSTQKQKEITQKLQNKIQTIELQKKGESKRFQESLHTLQKQKEILQNNVYFLQKDLKQLHAEIKTKQRKITHLQMAIRAKQNVLVENLQEVEQKKKEIDEQHQLNIKEIKDDHAKEIKQLMSQHLAQIDAYYQRINNLQQLRIKIETHYKEENRILHQKFSERSSKPQDIEEIQRLTTLLLHRDREIYRYQDQLKGAELMRENNEKNYTKIFHSCRRKSANSHKDKQAFFKQGNTTDLKLLLKICHKEF